MIFSKNYPLLNYLIGTLLLLCSEDMENHQVCLAFAITTAHESFEEWQWFLKMCCSQIENLNSEKVAIITDRAKGDSDQFRFRLFLFL